MKRWSESIYSHAQLFIATKYVVSRYEAKHISVNNGTQIRKNSVWSYSSVHRLHNGIRNLCWCRALHGLELQHFESSLDFYFWKTGSACFFLDSALTHILGTCIKHLCRQNCLRTMHKRKHVKRTIRTLLLFPKAAGIRIRGRSYIASREPRPFVDLTLHPLPLSPASRRVTLTFSPGFDPLVLRFRFTLPKYAILSYFTLRTAFK